MSTISISKFGSIDIDTTAPASDVQVIVTSDHQQASYLLGLGQAAVIQGSGGISVKPVSCWLEGSNIQIYIAGVEYKDSFLVPGNLKVYSPEELLYSRDLLAGATYATLETLGLATEQEISLLQSMGPKLTDILDKIALILCRPFRYDGSALNNEVFRVRALRRMQYLAYIMGLDSLVESVLLSPGPERSWFRGSAISLCRPDDQVLGDLPKIRKSIESLRNYITRTGLNTDVVDSIDFQVDVTKPYSELAKSIAIIFAALRYTHDNPKFSY